jgi:hypothetical protein
MTRDAVRRGFLVHCLAFLFALGSVSQTTGAEPNAVPPPSAVQQVLSWLPSDTETVVVANLSFLLPDLRDAERNREFHIETAFKAMSLRPLLFRNGSLLSFFKNQPAVLALEGSRHFRTPGGLGLMPFEGCTIVVFADDLGDRADLFFNSSSGDAFGVEEIEGEKTLVFQEQVESYLWTTFIVFKKPNVLLVATNHEYLRELLSRMRDNNDRRALPETLPEWKYVNASAQFWALRHFDRSQGDRDPSSPFWDPKKFVKSPWNDEQAIGLTFNYDPVDGKAPIITYLSGNPGIAKRALAMEQEASVVGVAYRELDLGAIEASYSLGHWTAPIFGLLLPFLLGHGIFL